MSHSFVLSLLDDSIYHCHILWFHSHKPHGTSSMSFSLGATLGHSFHDVVVVSIIMVPPWAMIYWSRVVRKEESWTGFEPRSTGPKPSGLTTWPPRLLVQPSKIDCLVSWFSVELLACVFCPTPKRGSVWILPPSSFWTVMAVCSVVLHIAKILTVFSMRPVATSVFVLLSLTVCYEIQDVSLLCCYVTVSGIKGLGSCQLTVSSAPTLHESNSYLFSLSSQMYYTSQCSPFLCYSYK